MTSEIQQNRYDRLLRRVAGIIGPGSKVSEVLTELFPVLDVESVPAELLILAGTKTAFGGGTVVGAAGESPKMGLFNPAGSNTIIALTDVYVATNAINSTVRWGLNTNQLSTGISTQTFTDTRNPAGQLPVGQISQESAVALANATGQTRIDDDDPFHLEGKNELAMLSPGVGFEVGIAQNTTVLFTAFYWRERPMESAEVLSGG